MKELWDFLKTRKKFWLLPSLLTLLLISVIIVLGSASSVSPFIYTIF